MSSPERFVMGDHEFLSPSEDSPLSRFEEPARQILGAPPPTYLDGYARQAAPESPAARELFTGEFCGHGEPAMTIFDVVIDGAERLEIGTIPDPRDGELPRDRNHAVLVARRPGGKWVTLFRREWEANSAMLEGVTREELPEDGPAAIHAATELARVSIGFEYPGDATSRDCVSWIEVHALFDGKRKPMCLVSAELA